MPSVVPMKALLEAGVHFGHRTRRWNPKMKPYIFTERNGIHIIDLQQTIARLNEGYELVKDTVASGGIVLFVGTKRQAHDSIVQEASRCNMPYVDQRWLGGTLTNWRTIRQRIDYLLEAEKAQARGEFARLVKKEALLKEREISRLNHRLGGLKEMRRLPNLLFVVDIRRDALAVKEANILGIPIIAMVDTNCNPDPIDHIIPSNDDAIRAIKLVLSTMANAVLDGQAILHTLAAEEEEVEALEGEEALERYLGPSTLAKIQAAESEAGEAEAEGEDTAEVEPVASAQPATDEATDGVAGQPAAATEPAETSQEPEPTPEVDPVEESSPRTEAGEVEAGSPEASSLPADADDETAAAEEEGVEEAVLAGEVASKETTDK